MKEEIGKIKVKVYDNGGITADRYTMVFPTGDTYLMSEDANMPNGVCMYVGENIYIDPAIDKRIDTDALPEGTKKKIAELYRELGGDLNGR